MLRLSEICAKSIIHQIFDLKYKEMNFLRIIKKTSFTYQLRNYVDSLILPLGLKSYLKKNIYFIKICGMVSKYFINTISLSKANTMKKLKDVLIDHGFMYDGVNLINYQLNCFISKFEFPFIHICMINSDDFFHQLDELTESIYNKIPGLLRYIGEQPSAMYVLKHKNNLNQCIRTFNLIY